jgi:exosortase
MKPEATALSASATAQHARSALRPVWVLTLGFAALAIPTAFNLAGQVWTHEDGEQGPIILATGAWILWRQTPELLSIGKRGATWLTATLIGLALPLYVVGRVLDFITLEAGAVYVVGLAMLQAKFGSRALARNWFPLLYLTFAIPPPSFVIDRLTAPLKHFVAMVSTHALAFAGLPVSRQGVTIMIAQYQLLVEDACSGMNSLLGLSAISLLYIYLMRRASILYSLLLAACVIPIAILANIVRIMLLILITYAFGDEVGQSFIHYAAGLVLFATALMLVFALDTALHPAFARLERRG